MTSHVEYIAALRRMTGYRLVRPDLDYDVAGVCQWLRQHPDGGWLQSGDAVRRQVARRLLWLSWMIATGRLDDGR